MRWAALVWCALTFVEDVRNTCPEYRIKTERPRWVTLRKKVETLADALKVHAPRYDEAGTCLYECVAWALDGIEFKPDERLAA